MDVTAANQYLDAMLGASKAAHLPASHSLELWDGHPDAAGSAQLDATGGYTPLTLANNGTTWPAAANGEKSTSPVLPGTGDYNTTATHFRLVSGGVVYHVGELDSPVSTYTDTCPIVISVLED